MSSLGVSLTVALAFVIGTLYNVHDKIDPTNPLAILSLVIIGGVPAFVCWLSLRVATMARDVLLPR